MSRMQRAWCVVMTAALIAGASTTSAFAGDEPPKPEGESYFFTPPGFEVEGRPITADGPQTGKLRIVVRDEETGKPTPCRIAVVGPEGNFYQPPPGRLSKYAITGVWPKDGAWGNRPEKAPWRYLGRFFYSTGEVTVDMPAGNVRVEVSKGFEFAPKTLSTTVVAGKTQPAVVTIRRTLPIGAQSGYFGGDLHLHFARESDADDEAIFDLLDAEDIWYGTPLGYNEPAGPYAGFMEKMATPQMRKLGAGSIKTRGRLQMLSGQEYRTLFFGHLNLYLRDRLVFEGQSFNADDGPVYGQIGAETQELGGFAFYAHGGYAQEIYADAALGTVNGVELLQFGIYRGIGLEDWYHMLNAGYRFPIVGASDFPACRFLADCRTYVWSAKPNGKPIAPPPITEWLRNAAEGKSFVTTGPIIELEVSDRRPGETLELKRTEPRKLSVKARVRSNVAPVRYLDLIVNGQTALHTEVVGNRQNEFELNHTLEIGESSWIAARAWSTTPGGQPDAESHTNPVYVHVDGKAPFQKASIDAWVARIDGQIAIHTKRNFAQKAKALAYFQKARDLLLAIRERGGLKSGEHPTQVAAEIGLPARPAEGDLALESSRPDPTEEELRAFLKPVPARSPAEALKAFEVAPGFEVQLVASEPLVFDPVAAAFDADGNLFVCELRDYPFKPREGGEPIGDLRFLRDTDGDGRYDESHVFAEKLLWAAGVVPWKGGVFVAAPPDIWYLKDTDGDHRADVRRKVFTGFGTENQQAMLNNLQMGLDHKIYGATAGNGGLIRRGDDATGPAIPVNGRDFRFDPVTEQFEPVTGTIQFGNTFDDVGNRFVCSESQPLLHIVLPDHYLARNPFLPAPHPIQNLATPPVPIFRISPVERWRQIRSSRRIAKNERAAASAGASHHVVDAAAGVTVYRGGAFPEEYYGSVFVGDGQNNLVHRRRLIADGVTFKSEPGEPDGEFLRSSDVWFRPVNFVNAPDGTLYCLDMSREVLESIHIPLDVVKHLDLASGRTTGRIYRIAPKGFKSPAPPRLENAAISTLVAVLDSPHGWWRDTAHRLLYERQDRGAAPPLIELARHATRPATRIAALWSLEGLESLDEKTLLAALTDGDDGVRETAVRLSESRLNSSDGLLRGVVALAADSAPRVRFQVAFSLGEARGPAAVAALAQLARRDGADPWIRTAVLSSATAFADRLFATLLHDRDGDGSKPETRFASTPAGAAVLGQLAHVVGARRVPEEMQRVLEALSEAERNDSHHGDAALVELVRGMRRAGAHFPEFDWKTSAGMWLNQRHAAALALSRDPGADEAARRLAIEIAGGTSSRAVTELLLALLGPDQPDSIRIAAIQGLTDRRESEVTDELISRWNTFTPDVRKAALEALLAGEARTLALFRAAAAGDVNLADFDPTRRDYFAKHRNDEIRGLARQLFGPPVTGERAAVLADYQKALQLDGDAKTGQGVFERSCGACHQVGGRGHAVGPNLASSASRDPRALLTHILDPNQYVLPNYIQYIVVDQRGKSFTGLLAGQTATSVTLRKEKSETVTILRGEIDEMVSSGKSLMPEGVEKTVSVPEMAHLIAFLIDAAASAPAGQPHAERDFGTLPGLVEPKPAR
jgi:putative membrane-bound dehydrogenase-like protein